MQTDVEKAFRESLLSKSCSERVLKLISFSSDTRAAVYSPAHRQKNYESLFWRKKAH